MYFCPTWHWPLYDVCLWGVALSNSLHKTFPFFLFLLLPFFVFISLSLCPTFCLPPLINSFPSSLSPGEFFRQSRHGLWSWFCFWFYQRRCVSPASGRPLPHHPPPHQGVQIRRGQRAQRWVFRCTCVFRFMVCVCRLHVSYDWPYYLFFLSPVPDVPPSPLSVHDRYSSPAAGSAKRRLFGDDPPTSGVVPSMSPLSSPAKRLTFGSSSTLRIGTQGTQATVLSIPLQGRRRAHLHMFT